MNLALKQKCTAPPSALVPTDASRRMKPRAVVVVLDGLRRDMLGPDTTPELHAFAANATAFAAHRSVFPSATRVVSSCFATGCLPATHGLQGNSVALMEDGRLVPQDVGRPDFMDHWRRVRGRTFAVPTMAERLARAGRTAMVFSNVSPGAARAHDPDGHGWVFHRAWSHAPGLRPVSDGVADITLDAAGDQRLTGYFLDRAQNADLAVLWLGEPDHAQHEHPLGSPEAMAAIAAADACFGRVRAATSPDTLLIACSDHGHQTVGAVIDIDAEFTAARLKAAPEDPSLLSVSNGTSALIYLHPDRATDAEAVLGFLRAQPWAGAVLAGDDLRRSARRPRAACSAPSPCAAKTGPTNTASRESAPPPDPPPASRTGWAAASTAGWAPTSRCHSC